MAYAADIAKRHQRGNDIFNKSAESSLYDYNKTSTKINLKSNNTDIFSLNNESIIDNKPHKQYYKSESDIFGYKHPYQPTTSVKLTPGNIDKNGMSKIVAHIAVPEKPNFIPYAGRSNQSTYTFDSEAAPEKPPATYDQLSRFQSRPRANSPIVFGDDFVKMERTNPTTIYAYNPSIVSSIPAAGKTSKQLIKPSSPKNKNTNKRITSQLILEWN